MVIAGFGLMNKELVENLTILHEDNHIIVVLKPQNIPSCEDESKDENMLSIIKEYIREKYGKQGNVYLGLVHRLDRPTGGVMVFARNSKCASRLVEQFENHEALKSYYAITCGVPREKKGKLVHYLKKDEKTNN